MKIPTVRRQRVRFKSFHRQWRRMTAHIDFYFARIKQRGRRVLLAELAAQQAIIRDVQALMSGTDVATTDNGDGTFTHTFTPRTTRKNLEDIH